MSDVPDNAPESCPGTGSENAGKSSACAGCPNQGACATGQRPVDPDEGVIADRLQNVKHKASCRRMGAPIEGTRLAGSKWEIAGRRMHGMLGVEWTWQCCPTEEGT